MYSLAGGNACASTCLLSLSPELETCKPCKQENKSGTEDLSETEDEHETEDESETADEGETETKSETEDNSETGDEDASKKV